MNRQRLAAELGEVADNHDLLFVFGPLPVVEFEDVELDVFQSLLRSRLLAGARTAGLGLYNLHRSFPLMRSIFACAPQAGQRNFLGPPQLLHFLNSNKSLRCSLMPV